MAEAGAQTPYHAFTPVNDTIQRQTAEDRECLVVGIGLVKLPRYLDRPQIAANVGDISEILPSEENRRVDSLPQGFPCILARNLCPLMCTRNAILYPWRTSVRPEYVVDIEPCA